MGVLDLQRRSQQIGRLRMGEKVGTGKFDKDGNEKMRPSRRDTWRLTTASRFEAEAIAARFGGEVRHWEREFEVATDATEIPVIVPPRDEVISQWYEMWNKGGAVRRCDSQRDQISNSPCLCPHAKNPSNADEVAEAALKRAELSKTNPPQACKLVTRISVMIPDLPGLGVFRLDTGSYYAGVEIGDSAALMQYARDHKVMLPAMLRIEQRKRVAGGMTKNFPVPVLEVIPTFRELTSGALERAGVAAQLPPAPGEQRRALTTGAPAASTPAPAAAPQGFDAELAAITEMDIATAGQRIVGLMSDLTITPAQMNAIKKRALDLGVWDDQVCTGDGDHEVWEEVHSAWQARWDALSRAAKARRQPAAVPPQDALPVEDPPADDWPPVTPPGGGQ
jgi:hypothetical protein